MLFLLLLSFCSSLLSRPSDNPFRASPIGCRDLRHLKVSEPFAHGQKKEVVRGSFKGLPVVIARPFDGDFVRDDKKGYDVAHLLAHYENYFRSERKLLQALESDYTPHFYGGCWTSFKSTLHVVEYLRGYMDLAVDRRVTLRQRVAVAASTLELLELWERFPLLNGTSSHAIYGDLFAKQFAVDAEYHVKIVDVQSFFPYAPRRRFGDNYACRKHADCTDKYWYAPHYPSVMRGLRGVPLDDLGCDARRGVCRGLDTKTTLAAFCLLLLHPLFTLAPPMHAAQRSAIAALLQRCVAPQRAQRPTHTALANDFRQLLQTMSFDDEDDDDDDDDRDRAHDKHRRKLPPLSLSNAPLAQAARVKTTFEAVRKKAIEHALKAANAHKHH